MMVRVDQSGRDDAAGRVDHVIRLGGQARQLDAGADGDNHSVAKRDCTVGDFAARIVHADDERGVPDDGEACAVAHRPVILAPWLRTGPNGRSTRR